MAQQTIRIPWTALAEGRIVIAEWQRQQAAVVRSAYGNAEGRTAQELKQLLKARFVNHGYSDYRVDRTYTER